MEKTSNFLMDISILFRNTQKYLDSNLSRYGLGAGQYLFLLLVNEHEGISMLQLTLIGEYDKGTTSKSLQKLVEQDYIQIRTDDDDKRIKRVYTTAKAQTIMKDLYEVRRKCNEHLLNNSDEYFETKLTQITDNSRTLMNDHADEVRVGGLQKLTLLDYPDKVACTIFTAGCNFKCPFCHNRDLVFTPENFVPYQNEEIFSFLEKRKGLIDGVCISGGEPLLQPNLEEMIMKIKKMGYQVKLDTNGFFPTRLKDLIESGLIDYVAMDIKNCKEKYATTIGINPDGFDLSKVEQSVDYLMKQNKIEYEFRTTVVKELHDKEDFVQIGKWIKNAKKYYLQSFVESEKIIVPNTYHAMQQQELEEIVALLNKDVPNTFIRGGL